MPRTKVAKDKKALEKNDTAKLNVPLVVQKLREEKMQCIESLRKQRHDAEVHYQAFLTAMILGLSPRLLKKTLAELSLGEINETTFATTVSSAPSGKSLRRSASFTNDEGYSTAESQAGSVGRQSRSRSRVSEVKKTARSLSRSNVKKAAAFKTPARSNKPPTSTLTITPKFKPNTAQVLLRRPKQGEVALSMQGSPLFVGPVVADNLANVNIPAPDGYTFTLQPQRGLRLSQIPAVDPEVTRQLTILRDHLNKVCALSNK